MVKDSNRILSRASEALEISSLRKICKKTHKKEASAITFSVDFVTSYSNACNNKMTKSNHGSTQNYIVPYITQIDNTNKQTKYRQTDRWRRITAVLFDGRH